MDDRHIYQVLTIFLIVYNHLYTPSIGVCFTLCHKIVPYYWCVVVGGIFGFFAVLGFFLDLEAFLVFLALQVLCFLMQV